MVIQYAAQIVKSLTGRYIPIFQNEHFFGASHCDAPRTQNSCLHPAQRNKTNDHREATFFRSVINRRHVCWARVMVFVVAGTDPALHTGDNTSGRNPGHDFMKFLLGPGRNSLRRMTE
ncbi:hypothetical protein CDAR_413491 [Caerostris darwini]|uniref:Uncharacterized protein n=1 Tax=Caerostris darwini TaxID=1538125 RepID=A0AAV4SB09_9ARAC|nr:hypothetical protein CDAR_413491 [Caerostris darwini]